MDLGPAGGGDNGLNHSPDEPRTKVELTLLLIFLVLVANLTPAENVWTDLSLWL